MTTTEKIHLAAVIILAVVVAFLCFEIREWRMDVNAAKATQKSDNAAIAEREKQFEVVKAQLEKLRVTAKTPVSKIAGNLQQLLGLNHPVEVSSAPISGELATPQKEGDAVGTGKNLHPPLPDAPQPQIVLNHADSVALNNKLVACAECSANVTKLTGDLKDMTGERDKWRDAASGGSVWQRVKRASKWLLIGAAAGAAGGAIAARH